MKKRTIAICVVAALIVALMVIRLIFSIDPSFADAVSIRYYHLDKKIDLLITDADDIRILKENLTGKTFFDQPSCGFDLDISITFSSSGKSLTLCPACDTCDIAQMGNSNRYIRIKDRAAVEEVLKKYGMTFPCV